MLDSKFHTYTQKVCDQIYWEMLSYKTEIVNYSSKLLRFLNRRMCEMYSQEKNIIWCITQKYLISGTLLCNRILHKAHSVFVCFKIPIFYSRGICIRW